MRGHFTAIGIGLPVDVVMQIVEFSHLRIAALEHFDVQLAGNHTDLFGCKTLHHAIHQITPGPETVLRIAGNFCQPGHHPLKRMGMQIRHSRHNRAVEALAALRITVRRYSRKVSGNIYVQTHIVCPAPGK